MDGLKVAIEPADKNLALKRSKVGSLFRWKCHCGVETLKISKVDIQNLPQDIGDKPVRQLWNLSTQSLKLTKEWNKINSDNKMFIEYFKSVYDFKNEHRMTIGALRYSGGTTSLTTKCSACGRLFEFSVSILNPVQPVPELTPLGAFDRFGLQNTNALKSLLAKWLHENKTFETTEDFLASIECLNRDPEKAEKAIGKIVEIIDSINPASERLRGWFEDLQESLQQVLEDFKKDSQRELEGYLEIIANFCKPRMYDIISPAERFP